MSAPDTSQQKLSFFCVHTLLSGLHDRWMVNLLSLKKINMHLNLTHSDSKSMTKERLSKKGVKKTTSERSKGTDSMQQSVWRIRKYMEIWRVQNSWFFCQWLNGWVIVHNHNFIWTLEFINQRRINQWNPLSRPTRLVPQKHLSRPTWLVFRNSVIRRVSPKVHSHHNTYRLKMGKTPWTTKSLDQLTCDKKPAAKCPKPQEQPAAEL